MKRNSKNERGRHAFYFAIGCHSQFFLQFRSISVPKVILEMEYSVNCQAMQMHSARCLEKTKGEEGKKSSNNLIVSLGPVL